jgi:hypothetical protein
VLISPTGADVAHCGGLAQPCLTLAYAMVLESKPHIFEIMDGVRFPRSCSLWLQCAQPYSVSRRCIIGAICVCRNGVLPALFALPLALAALVTLLRGVLVVQGRR